MVAARKAFVGYAVAARDGAGKLWGPDAVDSGLVALQVGKASEVCRRGAGSDVACPSPVWVVSATLGKNQFWRESPSTMSFNEVTGSYLVRLLLLLHVSLCCFTRFLSVLLTLWGPENWSRARQDFRHVPAIVHRMQLRLWSAGIPPSQPGLVEHNNPG